VSFIVDPRVCQIFRYIARLCCAAPRREFRKQIGAVVEDGHLEFEIEREPRDGLADVACPRDQESRSRRQRQFVANRSIIGFHNEAERRMSPQFNRLDRALDRIDIRQRRDRDFDRSAADEAIIPAVVVIQFENK
jgi:hypothetical protein